MRYCEGPGACNNHADYRLKRQTKLGAWALCEKHMTQALEDGLVVKDDLISLRPTDSPAAPKD